VTELVIGLTIYETDREGADLSTNSEVRCCKGADRGKALFPALMALLVGSGVVSGRQLAFLLFPLSTRRLRRSGDSAAGTRRIVHRPLGRFHLPILTVVIHRLATPKLTFRRSDSLILLIQDSEP
jgi:hypothetical protein